MSHPSAYIRDRLVAYDVEMERYETITEFEAGLRVCQLTTQNFIDFFIIATEANTFDWTEQPTPPNTSEAFFDNLDSSREMEQTRILKFDGSTGTTSTFVATNDTYPVQVGLHYMAGFENERHIRYREGIFAEARSTFKIYNNALYYRYAKWDAFGVAKIAVNVNSPSSAAVLTEMVSSKSDPYFYRLNFDFDVAGNGDVYLVSAEGTLTQSTQQVRKYDASANASGILYRDTKTLSELAGAYLGCQECCFADNRLYFVAPIQRVTADSDNTLHRDFKKSAGAGLFVMDADSFAVSVLERYDYVQRSCRSLVHHENRVYFLEYPNASTHYAPSNEDLPNYDSDSRQNTVTPNKNFLKAVVSDTETKRVIGPWYDERPFNASAVKMLSDGDSLHSIVRYGDALDISERDSIASKADNEQFITFGTDIAFVPETLPAGSFFNALVDLAKLGNARLEIKGNRLRFVDVEPFWATLEAGIGEGASDLRYKDMFKDFPATGYVLLDSEIIPVYHANAIAIVRIDAGCEWYNRSCTSFGDGHSIA